MPPGASSWLRQVRKSRSPVAVQVYHGRSTSATDFLRVLGEKGTAYLLQHSMGYVVSGPGEFIWRRSICRRVSSVRKGHVQCAIACAVLRTCSWRIATIRPSLPFGAPKVLAARRDDPTRRSVTDGHDPLCGQG